MKRTSIACAVAAALGMTTLGHEARASGFALYEQGASGQGYAFAGAAAVAEDATTVWWNPAGMGLLPTGSHLALSVASINTRTSFSDNGSVAGAGRPLGNTTVNDVNAFVPSLFFASDINPRWSFGVSINTPFGLKTSYDQNWLGRFQGIDSQIRTFNFQPSLSYKLSDSTTLGVGLDYLTGEIDLRKQTNLVVTEGQATVHTEGDGWGINAGAITKLGNTRLGVHYRSTVSLKTTGSVVFAPQVPANGLVNAAITLNVQTPDQLAFSAAHRVNDRLELLADATWWNWSRVDTIPLTRSDPPTVPVTTLNFHFRDTWRLSAGAKYSLDGPWMLKFGVAWDQSPVRNAQERTVLLPDENRAWLSAGVKYQMSKADAFDFAYTFVKVKNASINNDQSAAPARAGIVTGSYEGKVHVFGVQYQHTF